MSDNAGHLGSNLGAVELTLALHRVFDSPTDAIMWDTGHQAYVHKIVTGRQAQFQQLRQAGGLSGYPSREESVHDYVENSHASTVLSYAYGMAVARDLGADPHRHIVAVLGDGSLTGGMAYEALNNIGHGGRRVIMVLNDNGRSYAPTVSNLSANSQGRDERSTHPSLPDRVTGKLSHALTDIRLNPVYVRRQRRLEEFLQSLPVVGHQAGSAMDAFKAGVREFLQPPSFFEALGVRYVGPFDGHDIEQLEHALHNAIELSEDGPILVHVLTQKGRGYPPAEDDDEKHLHDAPVFDPLVGPPKAVATGYTQSFAEAIIKEAEADPRHRRHHRRDARPDRAAAVPGSFPRPLLRRRDRRAARRHRRRRHGDGRAAAGRGDLLDVPQPCVGPGRLRRGPAPPAGRVLSRPGRASPGPTAPSHHGVYDMALLSKVPGMRVLAPSSAQELAQMMQRRDVARRLRPGGDPVPAWRGPQRHRGRGRPWAHRPPGACAAPRRDRLDDLHHRHRQDAGDAEKAADELAADGVDVTVWDARSVAPLDPDDDRRRRGARARGHDRGRCARRRHRHDDRRPDLRDRPHHARRRARAADQVHPARSEVERTSWPGSASTPPASSPSSATLTPPTTKA